MNKQSVINLVAQILMFGVNLCISFFLTPYISEAIGVDAYGFVGLANDFVGYAQIITIALNSMASRFITIKLQEKQIDEANKYYSSVIIANIILSSVLAIIGSIFIIWMQYFVNIPTSLLLDVKLLFILIFANFIVGILTSTFSIATFCTNKLYLSSIKTIISQVIRVIILLITFIFFKPAVYYIGLAAVISTAYLGFCNYKYSKILTPELKITKEYFSIKHIKHLISSGIWNTLTKISGILSTGLNLLISNIFIGSIGMGIISISKTISNTILNAFGTISSVFMPELTISYAQKNFDEMKRQLLFTVKLLGIISAIPIVLMFSYGETFYTLWVSNQNANLLYALTCVSVFELCFSLPLEPLWNIFTVTNKVKTSSLYLVCNSILTIIMTLILLQLNFDNTTKMFIIVGVSVAFSVIRNLTFLPLYGAKCINTKKSTFYPAIIKNLITISIATLISVAFTKMFMINSWLKLICGAIFTAIISLILSSILVLNNEDRIKIKNLLNKVIKKGIKEKC